MKPEKSRVLLIDDEAAIRSVIRQNLEAKSYVVAEAETGAAGLEVATQFHPHVIVLDLGLPDMNGLQVLRELRLWTTVPVLILTVTDDSASKVELLDAGADDYLTKPFDTLELLARIRVSLRHHGSLEATPIFKSGQLEVDINQRQVRVAGAIVKFTTTEFELLRLLVREPGRVVHHETLLSNVWGKGAFEQNHYLRIYFGQIRKKIERDPSKPEHLITEPGVGYRIV